MQIKHLHNAPEKEQADTLLFKHGESVIESDSTIWRAFKKGNKNAFSYIFDKYSRTLYQYGIRFSLNRKALVEDAIQDLFVELWSKRESLGDTNTIKYYLLKSLRRKLLRILIQDEHRILDSSYELWIEKVEFAYEFDLIQQETDVQKKEQLKRAQDTLTKRQKEAIYLKFYEQMGYEEIASVMDLTIPSAYTLIAQALQKLRDYFS